MKKVFKYLIGVVTTLELPKDAKFLTAAVQHGDICLWFEVSPELETEPRKFYLVGTGNQIIGNKYLGTVFDSQWVWHIYEDVV